ncbi:pirin family protein [Janthinobacterium sp. GW460P]|uniref:pirin family protein n=1 Tax=unclassified Janthinobacterium TaxID=2610881 RepID=UPI000A31F86B|nr:MULTISPECIES: pirin family protein [unclassified Janthinobacterium]MCC7704253.1 pirin family protein [Janthinobacterium sp. GW460P]MCC7709695.1 pirin family protein [Janthinobacterium sp. GW460W]
MNTVTGIYSAPRQHWVGDGFPVRSMFSYSGHGKQLSPFLLLDYAGPAEFVPGTRPPGVGSHPHRGFETVTIVYQGEVAHRDSTGQGGVIGPGDVQWMTAGAGIVHEEFHSPAFTQSGGTLEMVQLWVNLPAKNKMTAPGYQAIASDTIPTVALPDDAGSVRVIAGDFAGQHGPARTFSPMQVWDVRLAQGKLMQLPVTRGWSTALIVLHGTVLVNGESVVREAQMALFGRDGDSITVEANSDAVVLLLSGEPIDEPIVGHGPFVMNTEAEIAQAFEDFHSGRFARLAP